MPLRVVRLILASLWCSLAFSANAFAGGVPINAFGRPGDLHIDFPTYAAPQPAGSSGHNDNPPGAMLRNVGDINGDGRADLAMSISSVDPSWTTATWVTFSPPLLPTTVHVDDPTWAGIKIVGAGTTIGGIAGLGDVNGDGFGDVAVARAGGGVWVVFGGPVPATVDVSNLGDRGFTVTNLHSAWPPGGGNGWTGIYSKTGSVLGVGDQNGDGRPDLAVNDSAGVRVIYTPAQPAGAVVDASQAGNGGALLTAPEGVGTIENYGDLNGDGRADIAVGWDQQGTAHSLVSPLPAPGTTEALPDQEKSNETWGVTAEGMRLEQFLAVGDDNGDGRRDLALSLIDQTGRHRYVVYGQPAGSHASLLPISDSNGHSIEDILNGPSDVGDQDGDGRSDLAYEFMYKLSATGQAVYIDQSLPECVPLKSWGSSALVLCSLEYKIAATLPDFNGDGKPEMVALHADPLPVEDGVTRATFSVDVFPSAPPPAPKTIEAPVELPYGAIDFAGEFLTAPTATTRSLAARATVSVTDATGHRATATGGLVDAGASATTRATVNASASQLGLVPGRTYAYRMTLENGRGLTGTSDLANFTYRPNASQPAGPSKRLARSLPAKLVLKGRFGKRFTVLTRLRLTSLVGGETVRFACNGKGCPAKRKLRNAFRARSLRFEKLFAKSKLHPGAVVSVRVTKPGARGILFRARIRKAKKPRVVRTLLS